MDSKESSRLSEVHKAHHNTGILATILGALSPLAQLGFGAFFFFRSREHLIELGAVDLCLSLIDVDHPG
jgi:hypothetical protein